MATNNYQDVDKRSANTDNQGRPRAGSHWPAPHHGMVSEYQQSGIPFVLTEAVGDQSGNKVAVINFPYVTRWVFLRLSSSADATLANVDVGFGDYSSSLGVQGDNFVHASVINAVVVPLELKCKKIKIFVPNAMNDLVIKVVAGLTSVPVFPDLDEVNLQGITTGAAITGTKSNGLRTLPATIVYETPSA